MSSSSVITILNVDDYITSREAASQLLRQAGFGVLEAGSGTEALRLVDALQPQLVLLDVNLPDMSGYEVCQRIKAHRKTAAIPVLLVSSSNIESDHRVLGLESGADSYLVKPVQGAEMMAAIRTLLRMRQAEERYYNIVEAEKKARRQAEIADRMKDEFLAVVSHELRAPLNAIQGWVRLLREGRLGKEETARALETIERSARAQSHIISDLLDVSRIISGKLRLHIRPVEPSLVIEAAIKAVRPAAEAKSIHLETVLDYKAEPISCDSDRLQQVVWNLLSNAIKFTPEDGCVKVRLEQVGSSIEITVSDSGAGIAPEFLPYVFDRFRQGDSSSTRRYGGLGMGLAIVRHLVEMHGGTVRVESQGEGEGATFIVQLPRLTDLSRGNGGETKLPVTEQSTLSFEQLPHLYGLRVLVVDDDPDAREVIKVLLVQCGADVRTAGSARSALAFLVKKHDWQPEVLISDIEMPEADGYQLIRELRSIEAIQGGRILAVALTAYAREEDRRRSRAAGFQKHLAKPVEQAELVTVLAGLTGRLGKVQERERNNGYQVNRQGENHE